LKFTETGEIGVNASYEDDALRLNVKDTGIGIAPEHLNKLFAKFTQADATTTRRFGGTGLGLAIFRDLATLMGGKINVESEVGRGTSFTVVIPLERVGDVVVQAIDQGVISETFGAGIRILAAEDNPTNQVVLRALLEIAGFTVVLVDNGAQAVAHWENEEWDLILMDMQMPVMDGLDAARAIRSREGATGRTPVPIIALTANTMAHQIETYLASGMDGHVAKPIDSGTLFTAIAEAINPSAMADSEAQEMGAA
jgi:CheY-like chemotaxis protein